VSSDQRRITFALCVIVGLSILVVAGLTFLVSPMSEDLGLDDSQVESVLDIPSVASLMAIFISGQIGDRLGHRRALVIASIGFILGSGVLASANAALGVEIGLGLCSASAIALQIVALGLLQQTVPDGRAHVSAFTTYGMVFPLAFLVFPVVTAGLLEVASWRWIPVIWALAGALMGLIAYFLLDRTAPRKPIGEWVTPVLAGLALTAASRSLAELSHARPESLQVVLGFLLSALAAVACAVIMHRSRRASFTLRPIGSSTLRLLLICVALVQASMMLTYISIALEYLYDLTALQAAIVIVPAQAGAVIGAKFVAQWAMHRWDSLRAARYLALALAISMLPLLLMQPNTPVWFLVAIAAIFSGFGMAVFTVLNTEVMGRAPHDSTGAVSAFRSAASSIGGALGVAVLGTSVISAVNVDGGQGAVSTAQLEQLAAGLRLDGVIAGVIALGAWVMLTMIARRTVQAGKPAVG